MGRLAACREEKIDPLVEKGLGRKALSGSGPRSQHARIVKEEAHCSMLAYLVLPKATHQRH